MSREGAVSLSPRGRGSFLRILASPGPGGFVTRLLLLWSPLLGLFVIGPLRRAVEGPLTLVYSQVSTGLLRGFGVDCVRSGRTISGGGVAVEVEAACTGYLFFWLLAGAVLAFPTSWRSRLVGIAGAAVLLFALNVLRIASLFWALGSHPELFDELHLVVWQAASVLALGLYWYAWASSRPAARA